MTLSKKQFYDLAGVPIREIFRILAEEQGVQPDLDAMTARCKELADEIMAAGPKLIEPVVAIAREAKAAGVPLAGREQRRQAHRRAGTSRATASTTSSTRS